MIRDAATHVLVSSVILALALIAARWIRPLTARTRHAILVAGMVALVLPAPFLANLLERSNVTAIPQWSGVMQFAPPPILAGLKRSVPQTANILIALWAGVAVLLLLRWWIVTQRLVSTAIRSATPPPGRAVRVLEAARQRLGLHRSVDLIASPTCEAPAVVRVLRPMIILPADGCETLDDEELESLLCHECAHVARRDNLLGVAEAVVCSLFWFNPLVWLTHRRIAAAREAACDERVADAALSAGTYAGALAKVCRALLAPRIPAVSCMASAHLKERIQHLMSYDTLRKSAFSHRVIAGMAMFFVVIGIGMAGVVLAEPAVTGTQTRYELSYSVKKMPEGLLLIRARVVDKQSGKVVGEPSVTTPAGEKAVMRFGREEGDDTREWTIDVEPDAGGGLLTLIARRNGTVEQVTRTTFRTREGEASTARTFSGEPITLSLADADIRDVLRVFGQLTGLEMEIAPEVKGRVTVEASGTPWDQALDETVRDAGFAYRIEGKKIVVFKP